MKYIIEKIKIQENPIADLGLLAGDGRQERSCLPSIHPKKPPPRFRSFRPRASAFLPRCTQPLPLCRLRIRH